MKETDAVRKPAPLDETDELGGCLTIFVMPITFFAEGVCLSWLWLWFLVPFGLPKIGVAHAFGLILTRKMLFGRRSDGTSLKKGDVMTILGVNIVALLIGYVTHRFMR